MMAFVYFGIAFGFMEVTGKFWSSMFWPVTVGEMLAREAQKRNAA